MKQPPRKRSFNLEQLEKRRLLAGIVDGDGEVNEAQQDVLGFGGQTEIVDYVLLTGDSVTVTADAGEFTAVRFLDADGDLVQAVLSGSGQMNVALDSAEAGIDASRYNLPGMDFMQGNATIIITGADETTNLEIYSLGSLNSEQGVVQLGLDYSEDQGIANIQALVIENADTFGSIFAGNTVFEGSDGVVGIVADATSVEGIVRIGDVEASGEALPVLMFGADSSFNQLQISGGDLIQPNGAVIENSGFNMLYALNAARSNGELTLAKPLTSEFFSRSGGVEVMLQGGSNTVGSLTDGSIVDAKVFWDANENGQYDEGELFAHTNAHGAFAVADDARGMLMAETGEDSIDILTGLPFSGRYSAPEGSSQLNPMTTILGKLMAGGQTEAEAQQLLQGVFGITEDVDIKTYDMLAHIFDADSSAADVQQGIEYQGAIMQLANFSVAGAALAVGEDPSVDGSEAQDAMFNALVDAMQSGSFDLTDASSLEAVIINAGNTLGVDLSDRALDAGMIIADANDAIGRIASSPSGNPISDLTAMIQYQTVAQGDAAAAMASGDFDAVAYTGADLDAKAASVNMEDIEDTLEDLDEFYTPRPNT